jgi:hypothetical protein
MLRAALAYAERGMHVFPIRARGKTPATKNGQDNATTDPGQISEWWTRRPNANIGVHCEPSGIYVVDIDDGPDKVGSETWDQLTTEHGDPATYEVRTQSGGRHLYFRPNPGQVANGKLRNTASRLGRDVDTRWNGYVVAPPSTGPHGDYTVVNDVEPAPLPEWIQRAQAPAERPTRPANATADRAATDDAVLARVNELARELAAAPEGQGNDTAARIAFMVGGYVGSGQLSETVAIAMLTDAISAWTYREPGDRMRMDRTIIAQVQEGTGTPRPWEAPRTPGRPTAQTSNAIDMRTRQPVAPADPEPDLGQEPESDPGELAVRYTGGTEAVFEQRPPEACRPYPRLVEVHGDGKDKPATRTTILRGTLAVPEVYTLRGIDSLCAPASGAAGDLYRARFETPTGHVFETPITDEELRKTRDLTWPGQLGVSRFTSKQALGRIPDAITAMAIDLPERQAYTATGLLLRPGRIPVYLRQGRPALTGRHGIYDNTAVTMLPGESESLRGVAFLRPPDPSTPQQACDDMLSLFDVLSVTTSDPLVLVLLLSELAYAPWSSLPGFARNAIFLAAPTGLGKTVLSGLVTAWQSDTFVPTVTDSSAVTASVDRMTGAGAAGILSQLRGLLASLDDFFPLGSSARELQRHAELLNVLGRGIKSGSEDAKADRGGALRVGRAMRTPVPATGEKFTDPTLSQSARYIHAELTADVLALKDHAENSPTGRSEALARVQANTADVARALSALIVDGLGALTDGDADRGPHAAQRWAEDEVGSWRLTGNNHLPPNYIGPMTGTYLIAERAGALGIADPSKVRDEFADHLRRCASEQARRSVSRSAIAERYGDVVAEIVRLIRDLILDGHRFRLDGPTLDTHPDVPGYTLPTFGWREITREYRDNTGTKQVDVISEPLPRFGNPIGTVHTYRPGTGPGRPPAWPTPPTSPVLRVAPDDFRRLYDAATEAATHLPEHGEARDLLAKIGYLRSRNGESAHGGSRLLSLDLGRVLAGNDDPGLTGDETPPGDPTEAPGGELATQIGGIGYTDRGIGYTRSTAFPQVSELATLATLATRTPAVEGMGEGAPDARSCPECGGYLDTERDWHGAVCLACLDRARTPDAPRCRRCSGAITPGRAARSPYCWGCEPPSISGLDTDAEETTHGEATTTPVRDARPTDEPTGDAGVPDGAWLGTERSHTGRLDRTGGRGGDARNPRPSAPGRIDVVHDTGGTPDGVPARRGRRQECRGAGDRGGQEPLGATRSLQEPRQASRGPHRATQGHGTPRTAPALGVLSHTGTGYVLHRAGREPVSLDTVTGSRAGIHGLALDHGIRTLAVHHTAAAALGWPTTPANMTGRNTATATEGWASGETDGLGAFPDGGLAAWVNVWAPGDDGHRESPVGVHVPCLDDRPSARWRDAVDGSELLAALVAFREATGDSYYFSPNATAAQIARRRSRGLAATELPPPAVRDSGQGFRRALTVVQSRPLDDVEDSHIFVHEYDANGQHIGAMGSELFGNGTAVHNDTPAFNPKRAGYWRIEGLTGWDLRMPTLALDDGSWIVTATGKMLRDLGCTFTVTEAWIYPRTHRPLYTIYEAYRDARSRLLDAEERGEPGARIARKSLPYATFTGWLSRKQGQDVDVDLYRPDWHDVILAEADARLLRRAYRIGTATGRWPVGVKTDALFYTSDELDPVKAAPAGLPLGRRLGEFTHDGMVPLAVIRGSFGEATMAREFNKATGASE